MESYFCLWRPKTELRHIFWDRLRFLRCQGTGPWVCAGDFNDVTCSDEHMGATDRSDGQMSRFRECLEVCELQDGLDGSKVLLGRTNKKQRVKSKFVSTGQ